jgi:hypothetical protein
LILAKSGIGDFEYLLEHADDGDQIISWNFRRNYFEKFCLILGADVVLVREEKR